MCFEAWVGDDSACDRGSASASSAVLRPTVSSMPAAARMLGEACVYNRGLEGMWRAGELWPPVHAMPVWVCGLMLGRDFGLMVLHDLQPLGVVMVCCWRLGDEVVEVGRSLGEGGDEVMGLKEYGGDDDG